MSSDLTRRTASDLADALAASETSSVELTTVHLDRIAAVDRVQEVAAEGIPPTTHALPMTNVFRDDVVVPPLGADQVLSQAPAVERQRFRVPRILSED